MLICNDAWQPLLPVLAVQGGAELLIFPSASATAMPDVDEYWRRVFAFSPFTVLFNLTGQPALTLPLGELRDGFPAAVQLVAPFGDEAILFRLGGQLEAARPWFNRLPPVVDRRS